MLAKIVAFFLIFMIVMGAYQKWRNPQRKGPIARLRARTLPKPRKCLDCGRLLLASEKCPCRS